MHRSAAFKLPIAIAMFFCILLTCNNGMAQFTGGNYHGFGHSLMPRINITDDQAFRGAADDGQALATFQKTLITDASAFTGGNYSGFTSRLGGKITINDSVAFYGGSNDGFTVSSMPFTTLTDNAGFHGGSNDGFTSGLFAFSLLNDNNAFFGGGYDGWAAGIFSKQLITDSSAFYGGSNDGFTFNNLVRINFTDTIVFRGGQGRGETLALFTDIACTGDSLVWNGSISINWENPANWNCNMLPNVNSVVIVPAGMPRYPTVSGSFEIKSIYLQPGTTLTILPGINFKLNGH